MHSAGTFKRHRVEITLGIILQGHQRCLPAYSGCMAAPALAREPPRGLERMRKTPGRPRLVREKGEVQSHWPAIKICLKGTDTYDKWNQCHSSIGS